ncbi:MAG: polysaccharide deacetylase family protein [Tepidiformaceae bacterium]
MYNTPPADFRHQVHWALEHGYQFVPPSLVAEGRALSTDLALTFDDGLASVGENAAPFLAELGIPFTLFIISGNTGGLRLDWAGISAAHAMGAGIGSHSVSHPDFSQLSAEQSQHELLDSAAEIESRTGAHVTEFAIPFGRARNWSDAAQQTARGRYDYVYSFCQQGQFPGTIPRTPILGFDGIHGFIAALEGRLDRWHD